MVRREFIVTVAIQIFLIQQTAGLKCRLCSNVESRDYCTDDITCQPHESCYMEEKIIGGRILFEGGCRSNSVCQAAVGKREIQRRDDGALIACSRCCSSNITVGVERHYCNDFLCGLTASNLHECYQCTLVPDIEECNHITTCNDFEVCGVTRYNMEDATHRYSLGCRRNHPCIETTRFVIENVSLDSSTVGRRSPFKSLEFCCGGPLCNTGDPDELAKKLKALWNAGNLNKTTLTYIPPTSSG